MEVSLIEMLDARERRVMRQQQLLAQFNRPLICFTMNIAGPIKDSLSIRKGYAIGKKMLEQQMRVERFHCIHFEETQGHTGSEAIYVLDAPGEAVKTMTCRIEDHSDLGRLFDMDVIAPDGEKYGRTTPRTCLICGNQAQVCARSRSHTVPELQARTRQILENASEEWDAERAAAMAVQALLYEVGISPKPGLVDRYNSGSHKDMDFFTFQSSAVSLYPYFRQCCQIGRQTADAAATETFRQLRVPGQLAEGRMYGATGGINTHKGAIFSLGILCGALGRLDSEQWKEPETVLRECAVMTEGLTKGDFHGLMPDNAVTAGQKLYLKYGITGVRGQAEAGFPAVWEIGLPKLEEGLNRGLSINDAACAALLAILADSVDTNLISRSNYETQQETSKFIACLLENDPFPGTEILTELDQNFREKNLSPGGSADLLAMTLMLHFLKEEN